MPDNRLLLDNMSRRSTPTPGQNFRELPVIETPVQSGEVKMETAMAKNGLHRYGSTWVTQEELDRLKKNESAIQDQMSRLDAQYKLTRTMLANLEAQISRRRRTMTIICRF